MTLLKLILLTSLLTTQVWAAQKVFDPRFERYPEPADFLLLMKQKFPVVNSYPNEFTCNHTDQSAPFLGGSDTNSGETPFPEPPPEFVKWYIGCINAAVHLELIRADAPAAILVKTIYKEISEEVRILSNQNRLPEALWRSLKWQSLSNTAKSKIISIAVNHMIGLGVLNNTSEFEYLILVAAGGESLTNLNIDGALRKIFLAISLTDEFLKTSTSGSYN